MELFALLIGLTGLSSLAVLLDALHSAARPLDAWPSSALPAWAFPAPGYPFEAESMRELRAVIARMGSARASLAGQDQVTA
jgi:hypothetical protein